MRTIVLHGACARACGRRRIDLDVASPAEAVRALCALFPAFRALLYKAAQHGLRFHVWRGDSTISADELPMTGAGVIRISPEVRGAKRGGVLQTIIGAVLVVVGAIVSYLPGGQSFGWFLIKVGAAVALGGVAQMLTPTPKSDGPSDKPQSNFFNGPVNVAALGNPVPILYGRLIVGSVVISAGIEVDDIPVGADPNSSTPTIDFGP
jgi:predicted phage tail protein